MSDGSLGNCPCWVLLGDGTFFGRPAQFYRGRCVPCKFCGSHDHRKEECPREGGNGCYV